MNQAEIGPATSTQESRRIVELKKGVREPCRANEILKAASVFFPRGAQRLRGRWCWGSSPERRTAAGTEAGLLPNPIFMGRLHGPSRLPEGRSRSGAHRRPDGNPPTPPMYQRRGPLL